MALSEGTRLGPYEIVERLGAGGMGEVYRARDTRLERTVAIKVLNSQLVATPELRGRFEREAKVISQLQHPHICTLYDVGHQDGTDFLVMEYLEGETLGNRLRNRALPLKEVLRIGMEIANALDKAHRSGVVHRDMKPGNIMLTRSGAKLLDFGLAKPAAVGTAASSSAPLLSAALTMTSPSPQAAPLTTQGTLVGTVQYMSPEQIQGKDADARSDIFGLGAVLYEMATGRRAFQGKSQLLVATAILEHDPEPLTTVQPTAPPALDQLIRTCLAKDPDERYQSAMDVKLALRSIAATPLLPVGSRSRDWREWLGWAVAGVLLIALASGAGLRWLKPERSDPVALTIVPPTGVTVNFSGLFGPPAISPDGTRIAVVGSDAAGTRMLFVRSLGNTNPQPLPGTSGASYPFWSPDGRQIGFFTSNRLEVADAAGGPVLDLCGVDEGRGGSWSPKGEIVFGTRTTGLFRMAASGGTPKVLTKLQSREANHRFPTFLPDGEHVAYVVQTPGTSHAQVVSLVDPKPRDLPGVISNVAFAYGRILHVRDGSLIAQSFDLRNLVLGEEHEFIAKPVAFDGQFNYAAFAASAKGLITYEQGSGSTSLELAWLDRAGKQLGRLTVGPGEDNFDGLRVSPRGERIVYNESSTTRGDVWVMQLQDGTRTRVSFGSEGGAYGVWSPAGDQLVYQNGIGGDELLLRASNGTGEERVLAKLEGSPLPQGWSADGAHVIFEFQPTAPNSPPQIWVAPLKPGEAPRALVQKRSVIPHGASVSYDGNWLAYTSDESGRNEVYVIPLRLSESADTLAAGKWQVSTEGGGQPRWGRKSDELFFINPSQTALFSAKINVSHAQFQSGAVRKLFDLPLHPAWAFYDVAPNGNIYMLRYVGREASPLTVMLNWRPATK